MVVFVDRYAGINSSVALKAPVRVATTGPITLNGFQTIDGQTLSASDSNLRVMVKNQADQTTNGLYDAQVNNWTRCVDFDGNTDFVQGTQVFVVNGTVNASTTFVVTTTGTITLGTSLITFAISANFGGATVTATEFVSTAAANASSFIWGNGAQQVALSTRDAAVASGIGVAYLRPTTLNTPGVLDIMPNGDAHAVDPTGVTWIDLCSSDLSPANSNNFMTLLLACLSTGEVRVGSHYGGTGTNQILKLGGLQVQIGSQAFGSIVQYGYFRDLGMYVGGSGTETFAVSSSSTGAVDLANGMALQWAAGTAVTGSPTFDTSLIRDGAGILGQRNGTTAQLFQQYKTYTDASDYERLFVGWDSANSTFAIKGQHSGTGSARSITITADDGVNSAQLALATSGTFTFNVFGSAQVGQLSSAGVLSLLGALATSAPTTQTGSTYSMGASDSSIICNDSSGTLTLTLLAASSNAGRFIHIKTTQNQTVVSASSNVVPLIGGSAGTAILSGTAGKWALLQSDGSNWIIIAGN